MKPIMITSDGTVTSAAFKLRPMKEDGTIPDSDGLSLVLKCGRSEAEVIAEEPGKLNRPKGAGGLAHLIVGDIRYQVRGWKLEVVQDEECHAAIKGMPQQLPDSLSDTPEGLKILEEVEDVAIKLARLAKVVWKKPTA